MRESLRRAQQALSVKGHGRRFGETHACFSTASATRPSAGATVASRVPGTYIVIPPRVWQTSCSSSVWPTEADECSQDLLSPAAPTGLMLEAGSRTHLLGSALNGDSSFQVFWEDGDRVFCRGWGHGGRGSWKAGLAVLPVAEPLGGSMIDAPADGSEPRTRLSVSVEG
jgi:hypothetical protein